jgi:tight adherence protein B
MSGLAAGLLGLAALLADRAFRRARHVAVIRSLRPGPPAEPNRLTFPRWAWGVVAGVVGWSVGEVPGALGGVMATEIVRRVRRRRLIAREAARTHEQLADTTRTIVSALRAGLSIPQALAYAAREAQQPLADGLTALVGDLEAGVPFDEALDGWAERAGGDDPRLLASVLRLHRRTGGDLPMVLDRVGDTLRERLAARREVRALTAQARLSGAILGFLPIGFFGFLWLTSRSDVEAALHSAPGLLSVAVGLALEAGAFVWIRALLEVR